MREGLPQPFERVVGDFRVPAATAGKPLAPKAPTASARCIRVVQWNAERGLEYAGILAELRSLEADVLILQELDLCCDRTQCRDVAADLARELGMMLVYVVEFEELYSAERVADAGQTRRIGQGGGVHGNAILTRFHIAESWSFPHSHEAFDWARRGCDFGEPRKGGRVVLGCRLHTGRRDLPEILVYSVHLENNAGCMARWRQFRQVLADMAGRAPQQGSPVLIGGDLNTLHKSVTKLVPKFHDALTLRNPGACEAEVWARELLPRTGSGLTDPFDKRGSAGGTSRHLGGWLTLKLDWLLSRGVRVQAWSQGPTACARHEALSDHDWLCVDIAAI